MNVRFPTLVCAGAAVLVLSTPWAHGADPSAATTPCATCHGAAGEGMPEAGFPRLAGQLREYLAKQLYDFREGKRRSEVMEPIARALDDAQIKAWATNYSSQPAAANAPPAGPAVAADDLGATLARVGSWSNDVPPCASCHGAAGEGVAPGFPVLAGQNRRYTAKQLNDWKQGLRSNDPLDLMKLIAGRLDARQIAAVAAYFEGVSPGNKAR